MGSYVNRLNGLFGISTVQRGCPFDIPGQSRTILGYGDSSMSDNTKALLNKYGILIIFGALAVFVGILAIVNSVQQSQGAAYKSISKEYQNLEDASIKYVELSLSEHYVSEGEYPTDTD